MAGGVELPIVDCRACGESLRGCWTFSADDLYCGMCGRRVFRLAFREEVHLPATTSTRAANEIWFYATPGTPLGLVAWGLHGVPAPGRGLAAVYPELDYAQSSARFEVPGLGTQEFAVELAKKPVAPADLPHTEPYSGTPLKPPRTAVAVIRLVPRTGTIPLDRLQDDGAPGRLELAGPHGGVWPARLLRLPAPLLDFEPREEAGRLPELVGYQSANGSAEVEVTVTAHSRAMLYHLSGDKGLSGIRRTTYNGVKLPCELRRGQKVRLGVVFDAEAQPAPKQPLTIKWGIAGVPGLIDYRCLVTLHPRPRLTIRPNGDAPEEVSIGGRILEFELLLDPATEDADTIPEIQNPPVVRLDPADGDWLRVVQFAPTPLLLAGPYPLRLALDTTRLDRAAMNNRVLSATVAITDQAGTEWSYVVRVRAVRLRADEGVLALDWGTTNTCAAHSTGPDTVPRPLALPPPLWRDNPPDYEQFPSVVYFEDISDPKSPVFYVGPEARETALTIRNHPECLIHSLKRRFRTGIPVYVRDEAGREHAYPVEDITRRVILRMIELAEHELGREVRHVGVTFPTKWPAATRRRFDLTLRRVAADLTAVRKHGAIEVHMSAPDIDEANAVALNVLHELQVRGKLNPTRPFTLVAYDFGGGTIDTSVLLVTWNEAGETPLTTRYLGIGGRADFGGDELTRAVILLLCDRINRLLENHPKLAESRYILPIRRAGDPPDQLRGTTPSEADVRRDLDALKNWEQLRRMAEEIKRGLCRLDLPADADPVRQAVESRLTDLACHPTARGPSAAKPRTLEDLLQQAYAADRKPFFGAIRFGLDEVVDFSLTPLGGGPPFTVRERVKDTFLEIQKQLEEAGGRPADVIVLAGGGCRLPLVREMVKECLDPPPDGMAWDDPDRLIYHPGFAKQRVAHGKATYLALSRESDILSRGLARSVDVLHRSLVITRPAGFGVKRDTIVWVGEPVHAPELWHSFSLNRAHLKQDSGGRRALWVAVLMWQDGKWSPSRLGYFDLDPLDSASVSPWPLPSLDAGGAIKGAVRLTRQGPSRDALTVPSINLDLRVNWPDGREFGPFPFVAQVPPEELDERLQGECG